MERIPALADLAKKILRQLKIHNVFVSVADGTIGLQTRAPFSKIIVTAAGPGIPEALVDQLASNSRMIIPVGHGAEQRLMRVQKVNGKASIQQVGTCEFVKLVGEQGFKGAPGP